MPLKPYEEFAAEPLAFPIAGKTYTPPPISAQTGLYLIRAMSGDAQDLESSDPRTLWQLVLGDVYEEMVADDVPLDALARAGFAVLADWQNDRDAAVRVWESGINPEARAALAAALRDASTTSPNTPPQARSSSTRKRANTATTNSRTNSKPRASSGATSSRSGR